jgi:hypothetical protein
MDTKGKMIREAHPALEPPQILLPPVISVLLETESHSFSIYLFIIQAATKHFLDAYQVLGVPEGTSPASAP